MRNQRGRYRQERNRSNRDGGIGLAMYKMEQRDKAKAERFKPYNIHKTIAKAIVGKPRRRPRK